MKWKWREWVEITYPVERSYVISIVVQLVFFIVKWIMLPILGAWVFFTGTMEPDTFISTSFEQNSTLWDKIRTNETKCDPTTLRRGDRFFTSSGIFEWTTYASTIDHQASGPAYYGQNISTCDLDSTYTVLDVLKRTIVSDLYVVCNTTDFKAVLHTTVAPSTFEPEQAFWLSMHNPQKERVDDRARAAKSIRDHYEGVGIQAASMGFMAYLANSKSGPVIESTARNASGWVISPAMLSCWWKNTDMQTDCFNMPVTIGTLGYILSLGWTQNGPKYLGEEGFKSTNDQVIKYLAALHEAVRFNFGCPNNGSNPLQRSPPPGFTTHRHQFDVYYQCTTNKYMSPVSFFMSWANGMNTWWTFWVGFLAIIYLRFPKQDDDEEKKPLLGKYDSGPS